MCASKKSEMEIQSLPSSKIVETAIPIRNMDSNAMLERGEETIVFWCRWMTIQTGVQWSVLAQARIDLVPEVMPKVETDHIISLRNATNYVPRRAEGLEPPPLCYYVRPARQEL